MKVKFDETRMVAKMDNDAIKAVRFVLGYSTNLDVILEDEILGTAKKKVNIIKFLYAHKHSLLDVDHDKLVAANPLKYANIFSDMAEQIIKGRCK